MDRLAALFVLADKRTEITIADLDSALVLVTYSIESLRYVLLDVAEDIPLGQKILSALISHREQQRKNTRNSARNYRTSR